MDLTFLKDPQKGRTPKISMIPGENNPIQQTTVPKKLKAEPEEKVSAKDQITHRHKRKEPASPWPPCVVCDHGAKVGREVEERARHRLGCSQAGVELVLCHQSRAT